jgi:hypothetical protein
LWRCAKSLGSAANGTKTDETGRTFGWIGGRLRPAGQQGVGGPSLRPKSGHRGVTGSPFLYFRLKLNLI